MTKPFRQRRQPAQTLPQLLFAFPTKGELDPKQRAEVVALLSRLLLQVARASRESEVADDAP